MRVPYIFIDRSFLAAAELGAGEIAFGLSGPEALGVVMVHELLHAAGRIPHDGGNTPVANAQSRLNTLLVKLFCVTLPNQPLTTTSPSLNNTPLMRPVGGGGGGGGGGHINPIFYGGGGGGFDSFRWLDVWARSGSGGYGEVIGHEIHSP